MEKKLAEFRARRLAENADRKSQNVSGQNPAANTDVQTDIPAGQQQEQQEQEADKIENKPTNSSHIKTGSDWLLDSSVGRWLSSKQLVVSNVMVLKVLLWLVLLGLFAELQFGLPFFVLSLFYWLYEGLRSPAPRKPGELSAYSVFNPDCQPLLGAITAEQLEAEMGYRPLHT